MKADGRVVVMAAPMAHQSAGEKEEMWVASMAVRKDASQAVLKAAWRVGEMVPMMADQ